MYEIGMAKAIQIDDDDNVATVASGVSKGVRVEVLSPGGSVLMSPDTLGDVPFGHKIALKRIARGEEVVKYGEVIGVASVDIEVGEWLHTHNVESVRVPTSKFREAGE
jgi:altronate dehydratase small subunit